MSAQKTYTKEELRAKKENQRLQALSLSDCSKIVGIVSDLLSPLLTQKSREYMAAIIHAELKKGEK